MCCPIIISGCSKDEKPIEKRSIDPDPALTADYKPQKHSGWAGSNIYWDEINQRLTFKDAGYVGEENKYGGLFFKWGSLIGTSPKGNWSEETVIYAPTGVNGSYVSKTALAFGTPDWGLIAVGSDEHWESIVVASERRTSGYLTYLNNDAVNLAAYKGDICAYLSGRPGIPEGYWRMPTSNEFGAASDYTLEGPVWESKGNINPYGKEIYTSGYYYNDNAGNRMFIPAAGFRQGGPNGNLGANGQVGYLWSSSPDYPLGFVYGRVETASPTGRTYGYPVRCVKK